MQTPSEARGAGGIIGNFGEISADRGQLALVRFGRSRELNTQGVDPASRVLTGPPDYVARYQRFDVTRVWQNVSLSPDFPSVTRVIAGLYPQSGGQAVDGAIAIDPVAMAALLRLIGPITVSSWPEPITAENAERILLYEQYVRFPLDERVDFLAETTQQLWERLSSADLGGARRIVDTLGAAVAGKHLLISAVDPTEDAALGRAEINGGFRPIRSDSLAVVTQNGGGNKIDWFLRRSLDYRPRVDPGSGELTARLTVTLENRAPPGGLPDYLIGTGLIPPHPTGTNRLYLSVYTPWGLSAARIDGIPRALESETELGRRVYSTWVNVAPQGKAVVELNLRGRLAAPGEYELDLHAQPMVNPDQVTVGLDGRRVRRLVLEGDRTVRWARPATGQVGAHLGRRATEAVAAALQSTRPTVFQHRL